MDFIDTAYAFFAPVVLLCCLFFKNNNKIIAINLLAVTNILLILYSVFVARQLYALYVFGERFSTANPAYNMSVGWFEMRLILLLFLPMFFLSKKLSANIFLTLTMLLLLWWSPTQQIIVDQKFSVHPFYSWIDWLFKILNYICLLISGYALLWLLKKLPKY